MPVLTAEPTRTATADPPSIGQMMLSLGAAARAASRALALASTESKNAALLAAAETIRARAADILKANARDVAVAESHKASVAMLDRLRLDPRRVESMSVGLEEIARLADPVSQTIARWERPNGLQIERVRTPIGVIGVIYEARPSVTADAAALCLKAGDAVILRAGSETMGAAAVIAECIQVGLVAAGLPAASVQLVPTSDRGAVGEMLRMTEHIDVIVPRGGKSLIARVSAESRVPLFQHLEGICHTYVHSAADWDVARRVVLNAKMRRPGICGATETLLIDRELSLALLPLIIQDLIEAGCEVRGCAATRMIDGRVVPADDADWDTEYLGPILSVKVVEGLAEAIEHIERHSSHHTESIITEDADAAEAFVRTLDSAIVMINASTQFADGGEFGMGGEIGIATGKLHARGPVGVEQLTTFKYIVRGAGQCRP